MRVWVVLIGSLLLALEVNGQTAEQINSEAAKDIAASRFHAAITKLRAASHRFPGDGSIELNLGFALMQARRLEEAIAPLRNAAQHPSLAAEAHFLLAADYFESGAYAQAITELGTLENSGHPERALYMLEESNRRTGHVEQAKAAFHQLITRYPDSAWTHYLMGTAYEDQQQLDKAVDEYKKALEKDPSIPNANFAIGYIYWRQQDTENAREWLKREAGKGCHSLANFYLGEIARGDRDLQTAEGLYRRALECDPSNGEAHVRLGIVLADEKRYKEAIGQFKDAIRLQPNESSAHYHLAEAYSHTGQSLLAKAEYERVRQIQASKDNGVDITVPSKP
jgi:tetratricopeptide (TPR) repeat protein